MDERGEYLQVVDNSFFERLNWIPTYVNGSGTPPGENEPGTLSAYDTKTGEIIIGFV